MIAPALLFALTATSQVSETEVATDLVFACQLFRTDEEAAEGVPQFVDLRAVRHANGDWTLEWNDGPSVVATSFEEPIESDGSASGLRWQDEQGKEAKAYIAFADAQFADKRQYFWLSLDKPSLWQAPGYGCESQGMDQ